MVIYSHQKSKNAPIDCVRRTARSAYVSIIAVVLTAMVGCTPVGPDYILPEMAIPTRWNSVSTDVQKRTAQPSVAWWQSFNDPVLIDLVQLAKTDNLDIKEVLSRVREARMRRLKSRVSLFPALDIAASARKSGSSAESGSDLNVGLEAALNRLSLLTGKVAGSLPAELSEIRPIPVVSIDPAVGIPADVIRQRPDIRQAERELAAQTARIGVPFVFKPGIVAAAFLFLGSDHNEVAQLLAFERGADDYILTPISPALLAARIGAHLKRSQRAGGNADNQIRVGDLVVDAACREVFLAGQPIDLTTIQFELLWYLARRSGRVVSREELFEALYQVKYNGYDRSVDVYISRIRN
jgi:hypothetical protein